MCNWNFDLEFEIGIGIWNWNLELELEFGIWNWNLELEFRLEFGTWKWNLELEFGSEFWSEQSANASRSNIGSHHFWSFRLSKVCSPVEAT